jgi:hypothetical protein
MATLSEQVATLKSLVAIMEVEAPKVEKGTRAAATRLRKAALEIKKLVGESRKLATDLVKKKEGDA